MNRRKKIISIISLACAIMVFSMLIPASNGLGEVYATSTSGNTIDRSSPNVITDDDRGGCGCAAEGAYGQHTEKDES